MGVIGENIVLRRAEALKVEKGFISAYTHNEVQVGLKCPAPRAHRAQPGMGSIGVVLGVSTSKVTPDLKELASMLTMHIAAASPVALSAADVPAQLVYAPSLESSPAHCSRKKEEELFREQAATSGKPDSVVLPVGSDPLAHAIDRQDGCRQDQEVLC